MRLNKEEIPCLDDDVMSNFDRVVDKEVEKKLKQGNCYAGYPAWEFHGNVWYENNQFHCEIKRYRIYQETISADTLEEIMEIASDKYGYN